MGTKWQTKKLGEVCSIVKGKKPTLYKDQKGNVLPYLGARFMRGLKDAEYASVSDKNSVVVTEKDLIIICDGSKSGDMFSGFKGVLSSTMGKMNFNEREINSNYLKRFLDSNFDLFNGSKKGAAIPHLDFHLLYNLEIPLPSLEEQKKIVKMLDEKMGKIAEAKRLRAEALADTEKILSQTLHEIFEEGKKNGWEEKEVKDVCEHPQYGFTASSSREPVGPKMLRITDIQNGEVDWGRVPYCKCNSVEKYELSKGDIVFARTGATVGKSFLINDIPKQVIYASYLIRLRTKGSILPEFLYYFFQSADYWIQISSGQVGAAQPNVNGSKLAKLKLFVPSITEQQKIVAKLDALSEKLHTLRDLQTAQLTDLKSLERACLREAFDGEL